MTPGNRPPARRPIPSARSSHVSVSRPIEGFDYAEIAEMTGVSLGTVKSRIHRGRLALRRGLEDRMELFRG